MWLRRRACLCARLGRRPRKSSALHDHTCYCVVFLFLQEVISTLGDAAGEGEPAEEGKKKKKEKKEK